MSKAESSWHVYMIETVSGLLYTGITTDVTRRFQEHLSGTKGAKFFQRSQPKRIVFQEPHPDRSSASKREAEIKKLSRQEKIVLIGTL